MIIVHPVNLCPCFLRYGIMPYCRLETEVKDAARDAGSWGSFPYPKLELFHFKWRNTLNTFDDLCVFWFRSCLSCFSPFYDELALNKKIPVRMFGYSWVHGTVTIWRQTCCWNSCLTRNIRGKLWAVQFALLPYKLYFCWFITALKINMEPQNEGLEDDFPFPNGVIFRFHVSFLGCNNSDYK